MIDGQVFDPIRHFQLWRERDEAHQAAKRYHAAEVAGALDKSDAGSWPAKAAALNLSGIATHGGKIGTADNLRKFMQRLD